MRASLRSRASEMQTNVFCDWSFQKISRNYPDSFQLRFPRQCKIAWTTGKEGSMCKEPTAALGSKHVTCFGQWIQEQWSGRTTMCQSLQVPWRGVQERAWWRSWQAGRGLTVVWVTKPETQENSFYWDFGRTADRFGRREPIPPNTVTLPKSVFSYAMTEQWFAACMRIYTETVLCDGRGPPQEELRRKLSTIMESVGWVCEGASRDHEWVTELNVIQMENENLEAWNCDLDVPCVIHEAEILTESFGTVLRLDSLLCCSSWFNENENFERPDTFWGQTPRRRQGWMAYESVFWGACSGRCHWKARRIYQRKLWIDVES